MSDLEAIADRVEIQTLRGEFTDAAMMRDYDRLTCCSPDGTVQPHPANRSVPDSFRIMLIVSTRTPLVHMGRSGREVRRSGSAMQPSLLPGSRAQLHHDGPA
jgi:hypothetical protein